MKKLLLILPIILLTSCGDVVEQNEIALVFKTVGEPSQRDPKILNKGDMADNFSVDMISATRAPLETPNIKILRFPKGVQSYEFSGRPSIESPNNEELCVDANGGKVCFDIVVHMFIDETFPNLKERLIELAKAYQLRKYSGQSDALEKFIAGRFRQILRQPFMQYASNKTALDLVRNKTDLNQYVLGVLNERFNPLGLRFTLVATSSAIRVNQQQQERMNAIVIQDVKRRILKLKNEQILPLTKEIASIRLEGKVSASKLINQAKADKIKLISDSEKQRRKLFIDLIGKEHYVGFETMLNMVNNLEEGQTQLSIVPENSQIFMGQVPLFIPKESNKE